MSRGFVTAAEVARVAGVSRSAVSRTFTPGASVSPEVQARVRRAAEQLGYRVNRLAQSLISNRSRLVGVVASDLGSPFRSAQLASLSKALLARGMQCLLFNADAAEQDIAPLLERILEFRARAIVVTSGTPPSAIVAECLASGVRVILVNKALPGVAATSIACDDDAGAALALDRLLAAGRRRLALIGSGGGTSSIRRRLAAFQDAARRRGLDAPLVWEEGPTAYATGVEAARALLPGGGPGGGIDGAFCVTDLLALGFMDAARHELGRQVPRDLAVVGFDDIPEASWLAYDLTTIRQSSDALTEAVLAAIDLEAGEEDASVLTIPVDLVERGSAGATAGGGDRR